MRDGRREARDKGRGARGRLKQAKQRGMVTLHGDTTPHVEVPRVEYEKLTDRREGERSADVRQRVRAARARQARRFAALPRLTCNADMGPKEVRQFCAVEAAAQPLLKAAAQRLQLSARAFHRVLKLARTIADLADADVIAAPHLAEALQYRPRSGVEG
jgi:magnesium chelatase family protein